MNNSLNNFCTIDFRELANEIINACLWLGSYGLDYPKTRIGQYKNCLTEMAYHYENGSIDKLLRQRDFGTIVNTTFEATEMYHIYNGLHNNNDNSIIGKLHDFIKGPALAVNEDSSSANRARNIAFELHMAARLSAAGFDIDLTSSADIILRLDDYDIYIECKRPQKNNQFNARIKGALSQLSQRYKHSKHPDRARGIIALSIGKVANPWLDLLSLDTQELIGEKLGDISRGFIDNFTPKWRNPSDSRSIGVLVHLSLPAIIQSINLLTICNEMTITNTFTNKQGLDVLQAIQRKLVTVRH